MIFLSYAAHLDLQDFGQPALLHPGVHLHQLLLLLLREARLTLLQQPQLLAVLLENLLDVAVNNNNNKNAKITFHSTENV